MLSVLMDKPHMFSYVLVTDVNCQGQTFVAMQEDVLQYRCDDTLVDCLCGMGWFYMYHVCVCGVGSGAERCL